MKEKLTIEENKEKQPEGIKIRPALFIPQNLGQEVYQNFRNFAFDEQEQIKFNFKAIDFGNYFYVILNNSLKTKTIPNGKIYNFELPATFNSSTIDYFILKPSQIEKSQAKEVTEDTEKFLMSFIKYFITITIRKNEDKYLILGNSFLPLPEPYEIQLENSEESYYFYPVFNSCIFIERKPNDELIIKSIKISYDRNSNLLKIIEEEINTPTLNEKQKENLKQSIKEKWGREVNF
ncbi:MAG: hypothetical protein KatS3mg094_522 [Candidatus Parcubacteria bacterium]|nr:MAG: hypothetical protein KatS3mg094_522 [Candidatus Parcubacteria bacterium]